MILLFFQVFVILKPISDNRRCPTPLTTTAQLPTIPLPSQHSDSGSYLLRLTHSITREREPAEMEGVGKLIRKLLAEVDK